MTALEGHFLKVSCELLIKAPPFIVSNALKYTTDILNK